MRRQITLTEHPDGRWTAYDTATKTVTQGTTRDEALERLDAEIEAAEPRTQSGDRDEIDPEDPIFTGDPIMSVDMGDETIDDVLYGAVDEGDETRR